MFLWRLPSGCTALGTVGTWRSGYGCCCDAIPRKFSGRCTCASLKSRARHAIAKEGYRSKMYVGCLVPTVFRTTKPSRLSRIKPLPQVYTLGCSSSTVFHFQLDETTGKVASTANYTADSSITGSQSGGVFVATAFELAVLVGRPDSDEVGKVALIRVGLAYNMRLLGELWWSVNLRARRRPALFATARLGRAPETFYTQHFSSAIANA